MQPLACRRGAAAHHQAHSQYVQLRREPRAAGPGHPPKPAQDYVERYKALGLGLGLELRVG